MQFNLIDDGIDVGFYLDFFQMFNWGVFDSNIYTMNVNQKSSLLTGANGSGKTTIVDAFLSLLVPPRQRFYNQSSGADSRKDRSELSYVLGAYGNKRESEYTTSKQKSLRNKDDAYSVLLGVFKNHNSEKTVSLMQMRFFSGSGVLQQVYCITHQEISMEGMQEAGIEFDRQGKWKNQMSEKFGTIFYGDSFSRYLNAFSEIFGFRSDRALYLFSQTVAVKVLGNLNEFVRMHMFESQNIEDEFKKLVKSYSDLSESYNEIEKVQEQIKLLKDVVDSGKTYESSFAKKESVKNIGDTIPLWYAGAGFDLSMSTIKTLEDEKNKQNDFKEALSAELKKLEEEILSVNLALNSNSTAQRLSDIENNIKIETLHLEECKRRFEQYAGLATVLKLEIPKSEDVFFNTRSMLQEYSEKLEEKIKTKQDEILKLSFKLNENNEEKKIIESELKSLSERNTNIPFKNISIRNQLCKGIGCYENDLPFAGELLQVVKTEKDWEYAIEKVLHNFSLCILVPENLYKKVNSYVSKNNMHGRIVYLKTDSSPLLETIHYSENSLPLKLSIKSSEFSDWIMMHLNDKFNYLCTDDEKLFRESEKAVTSTGLIKSKIRHEKDDREHKTGKQFFVLGWDNQEKRIEFSKQFNRISEKIESYTEEIAVLEKKQRSLQSDSQAVNELYQFNSWNDINTKKHSVIIDDLLIEKADLLKKDKDLKQLKIRLEELKKQKADKEIEYDKYKDEIGRLSQKLEDCEKKKDSFENSLKAYTDLYSQDEINSLVENLIHYFKIKTDYKTFDELDSAHSEFSRTIKAELTKAESVLEKAANNLRKKIDTVKNPKPEIIVKYPSWHADFVNYEVSIESLSDFKDFYNRLLKDDLPKQIKRFKNFFNEKITNEIIHFNTTLDNGEQIISAGIEELNKSLRTIPYSQNPSTYIKLENHPANDSQIKEFKRILKQAMPDPAAIFSNEQNTEIASFKRIEEFIKYLQENDIRRKKVLDVRNWFSFGAMEYYQSDNSQKQFYEDSASLSGGEKAKLAYTILASAIAFQFGITGDSPEHSFRFVIIDEAFSKIDPENSRYAMELFKKMGLQLMVVTPMDKINIVEDYVSSVQITESVENKRSHILEMTIERYREGKE